MAFVSLGGNGFLYPHWSTYLPGTPTTGIPALNSGLVLDAAGEMCAFIGHVWFAAGPGTSKTFSNAGGNIQFLLGAITWAGAGTTLRVGIQDVSAVSGPTAQPDESWVAEPYKDLVQGTDSLSANTWTTATIASGSRTLTHGDLIAVVFDMTVRNGADSLIVQGLNVPANSHRPVPAHKTGGTWNSTPTAHPNVVMTCDDGTLCSLFGALPVSAIGIRQFNTGSTPDEIGNIFVMPFDCKVDGVYTIVDPDAEFEVNLYSAAGGTPVEEQQVIVDPNQVASSSGRPINLAIGTETLNAGSSYAVTIRPTSVTNVTVYDCTVANSAHLAFWPGGTNIYKCTRSNDTGAFSTDNTTRVLCGLNIYQIDDGTGTDVYTDPGANNVISGNNYIFNNVTQVAAYVAPTTTEVKINTTFGVNQTGTYYAAERYSDPGIAFVASGTSYLFNAVTLTGTFSGGGATYSDPGTTNVKIGTTYIFNNVTQTGSLNVPLASTGTAGTVDIGTIKETIRYVLNEANTTTGSPVDLSSNLSTRVKQVMKVNPEKIRVDANLLPCVTVFASKKSVKLQTIAKDLSIGKRRADLTITIVGMVWNDATSDYRVDSADEDVEILMENIEYILRHYSTLNNEAIWQFPTDVTYHTVAYNEQTHMRIGILELTVTVYY